MAKCRMVKIINQLSNYSNLLNTHKNIFIADSACDQILITNIWTILSYTNRYVTMTGAFAGRNKGETFPVVSAQCTMQAVDGTSYVAIVHDALLDSNPLQTESLLSVHQSLRCKKNAIDDRSIEEFDVHGNHGTQSSRFGSHLLPFLFDGNKCFYKLIKYNKLEHSSLPRVIVSEKGSGIIKYRAHSRLTNVNKDETELWQRRLGMFLPLDVVSKTLAATTQYVLSLKMETRAIMRDHLLTRVPQLKFRRVNNKLCVDTFFLSITSIRGYRCWNLHSYASSNLDVVCLQQRRSQGLDSLKRCFVTAGVPHTVHCDNAQEFISKKWKSYLSSLVCTYNEPHHPNQNLAERRGGTLKLWVVHILTIAKAPLDYWCFCLEYVVFIRNVISRRQLKWRTPHEVHYGEKPDLLMISFFFGNRFGT